MRVTVVLQPATPTERFAADADIGGLPVPVTYEGNEVGQVVRCWALRATPICDGRHLSIE